MAEELSRYLRGWIGYLGKCETTKVLESLEEWVRHLAAKTAGSSHGPWRLSQSRALDVALRNAYFDSLGIPRLTGRR